MAGLKRLCPACGAANALERETCFACGAEITSGLAPVGESAPVPWKQVGTRLAISAGILALRAGLYLARRYLEDRAAAVSEPDARTYAADEPVRGRRRQTALEPRARVRLWGRRARGRRGRSGVTDIEVEEFYYQTDAE